MLRHERTKWYWVLEFHSFRVHFPDENTWQRKLEEYVIIVTKGVLETVSTFVTSTFNIYCRCKLRLGYFKTVTTSRTPQHTVLDERNLPASWNILYFNRFNFSSTDHYRWYFSFYGLDAKMLKQRLKRDKQHRTTVVYLPFRTMLSVTDRARKFTNILPIKTGGVFYNILYHVQNIPQQTAGEIPFVPRVPIFVMQQIVLCFQSNFMAISVFCRDRKPQNSSRR